MPSKEFSFCDATSLSTSINKSPYSWWQLPIEVRHDNHRRKFDSQLVSDIYRVFAYITIFFFDLFLFLVDERRDEWRFHTTSAWNETRNRDSCTELLHMAPPAFWRKRWNFHVFIFLFLCCFRSQVIKHATLLIKRSETSQNKCAISTEVNMGESNRYFVVPDENS